MPSRALAPSRSAVNADARLAQVRRARRGLALERFGPGDFLAGSGQIAFEPHAIGVAAARVGFDAFEAALQVARPLRALRQLRYPRARRVEFGRHAFEVAAGCRRFRAHLGQLQFDARQPFAQALATLDRRFGSPVRRVQRAFALVQLGAQLDQRFAQSARLNATRQNRAFALEASAGNRTAAGDLLAGQRDDGVAQSALAHEGDSGLTDGRRSGRCRPKTSRRLRYGGSLRTSVVRVTDRRREPWRRSGVSVRPSRFRQRVERKKRRAPGFFAV